MKCKLKPGECASVCRLFLLGIANTTQATIPASSSSSGLCGNFWQGPLMTSQEVTFSCKISTERLRACPLRSRKNRLRSASRQCASESSRIRLIFGQYLDARWRCDCPRWADFMARMRSLLWSCFFKRSAHRRLVGA